MRLTEALADYDHRIFQGVLLEASHAIPAESEEDCHRWRNVRLAEKGFLPFDEAIAIYQPIKPQDLTEQSRKIIPAADDPESQLPVPLYPIRMLPADNHFAQALAAMESDNVIRHIQSEFAHLCNRIIVADYKTIRNRDQLREIVTKACAYLNIGLERLSEGDPKSAPHQTAALITRHRLTNVFRVGFREALKLKWHAEKWLDQCWFARCGLRLTFWGEQWLGILGGLLLKKPLFYDNYKTGVLYREFASLEDIQTTWEHLNQIKAVDDLLSLMSIHIKRPSAYGFLTYKNLILTLWARHDLHLSAKTLTPLKLDEFKPFFEALLPGPTPDDAAKATGVSRRMKQRFLDWLTNDTGLKETEIRAHLGRNLEALFDDIENELGRVTSEDLDPRYVQLFLLEE